MRTTLTIDDDVAFQLRLAQNQEPSRSFKEIVNETLRRGFRNASVKSERKRFKVEPMKLGLREGLSIDNIEELLDIVEGPMRR